MDYLDQLEIMFSEEVHGHLFGQLSVYFLHVANYKTYADTFGQGLGQYMKYSIYEYISILLVY